MKNELFQVAERPGTGGLFPETSVDSPLLRTL